MSSHFDPERRSLRSTVGRGVRTVIVRSWWAVTIALVVVGVSARYDLVNEDRFGPLVVSAEVAASQDGGFAAPSAQFEAHPTVAYGGLDIALVEARAIPRNSSGEPIIVTELAIRNTTDVQVRLPDGMVHLVGPEGRRVELDRFEFTDFAYRLVVEPGQTATALAVFKLGAYGSPLLVDYELRIGEAGRWPVTLPLEGDPAPAAFPRPLEVDSFRQGVRHLGAGIELRRAVTALDHGAYRVAVGQHLAIVDLTLTAPPRQAAEEDGVETVGPALPVDRQSWSLIDGHGRQRAIRAVTSAPTLPGAGGAETVELQLVFAYETGSSSLVLQVGPAGGQRTVAEFLVQPAE